MSVATAGLGNVSPRGGTRGPPRSDVAATDGGGATAAGGGEGGGATTVIDAGEGDTASGEGGGATTVIDAAEGDGPLGAAALGGATGRGVSRSTGSVGSSATLGSCGAGPDTDSVRTVICCSRRFRTASSPPSSAGSPSRLAPSTRSRSGCAPKR